MKTFVNLAFLFIAISVSACLPDISNLKKDNNDCKYHQSLSRHKLQLFPDLEKTEIERRRKINLDNLGDLEEEAVVPIIIQRVLDNKSNDFITIDLRYYKSVSLGNVIFSNIKSDFDFKTFLLTSKYSQGFFSIFNFGKNSINILPPTTDRRFADIKIANKYSSDPEIIINVSGSGEIGGNMKFSENQNISIIADNIIEPSRLDLRESSNIQLHLNRKWIMNFYSVQNSKIVGGKVTNGLFRYINNKDSEIFIDKFTKSIIKCSFNDIKI